MEASDGDLLRRYRAGEVSALETLVERYRRGLFGYILNMTGNRHEAEDVFQEVWLRAIRKIGLYRQKNFFGWLLRIAHNLIVDRARRRKPDVSLDQETEEGASMMQTIAAGGPGPAGRAAARETGGRIVRLVQRLPAEQREVLVMRLRSGLSFREIAAVQKASINTVLARMRYACEKLRPLLKEEYGALGR